ncbi:hypothetical protein SLA2020_179290 [Shorea laevis]
MAASSSVPQTLRGVSKFSNVNLWNSRIREAVNTNSAQKAILLFHRMKLSGLEPNNLTFPFVAKACAKLSNLRCSQIIHTHIAKSPFRLDIFVQTTMVDMYVKCDRWDYAYKVFDRMPKRDVAAWNAMIVGFARLGFLDRVLSLFYDMRFVGIQPDSVTIVGVSQAVLGLKNLNLVRGVHSLGIQIGVDGDVSVANTLIAVYAKCGDLESAEMVLNGIEVKSIVSWNAIIAGHANFKRFRDAFDLYRRMLLDGLRPDVSTTVSLLSSCVQLEALLHGRLMHSHGIQLGCDLDISVINTLISMYSKCHDVSSARFLFDGMFSRSCVSWTAMISGYAEKGDMDEAMALFYSMERAGEKPDLVTVLSLVSGCGQTATLELGRWIDSYANSKGFKENVMVCNAMMDMYSKCGSLHDARKLFHAMPERTVISWTTMIAGCALNGELNEALNLFYRMIELDLKPNHITFLSVLQACTHAGFLEKGWGIFNMMTRVYNINPGLDHYSCVVDLLGRRGKLKEALEFVQNMPIQPDAGIWGALLSACKIHRNVDIGKYAAHCLFELEPHVAAPYVEMANLYASAGRWDGVSTVRSLMKCNKVRKSPGQSLIHVNGKNHTFTVEDRCHPEGMLIYELLDDLTLQAKDQGCLLHGEEIPEICFYHV